GGGYRGRTGPVYVPRSLDGIVEAVLGLDDRPAAVPHCGIVERRVGLLAEAGGAFTAPELAALYGFPPRDGPGGTTAIVELGGGINVPDLAPYFSGLGLPTPAVTGVSVDGGRNAPSQNDDNATLEVMLDIEVAGAVAPAAAIAVYFAPNNDQSFVHAVHAAVHDTRRSPSGSSISWGHAEDSWTGQSRRAMDQALQAAGLLGISVFVATGDRGSGDGVGDGHAHTDFPASSPHAIACGGTSLDADGTEVVWNNAP